MAVQQLEAALEGVRFGVEHQLNVRRSTAPETPSGLSISSGTFCEVYSRSVFGIDFQSAHCTSLSFLSLDIFYNNCSRHFHQQAVKG